MARLHICDACGEPIVEDTRIRLQSIAMKFYDGKYAGTHGVTMGLTVHYTDYCIKAGQARLSEALAKQSGSL